ASAVLPVCSACSASTNSASGLPGCAGTAAGTPEAGPRDTGRACTGPGAGAGGPQGPAGAGGGGRSRGAAPGQRARRGARRPCGRRRLDRQPDLVVAVGLAVVLEFLADGDDLAAAYHFAPHHGRFAVDDLAADPDRYGDVLIPPDDPDGTLALPLQEAGADPA